LEEIQICLHEELGCTIVIPRTQRQLFGKVINLLIAQADLLEEEEEILLPAIRQQMSQEQQLEMARRLLLDPGSEDDHWMLNWVAQPLSDTERQVLVDLVARFNETAPPLPPPSVASASTAGVEPESAALTAPVGFDQPIDIMVLIHKALSVDAWRTETITERLEIGETFDPFLEAFSSWMRALSFHADMEDAHMTPLLPDSPLARQHCQGF
jgi:hypothetical protein